MLCLLVSKRGVTLSKDGRTDIRGMGSVDGSVQAAIGGVGIELSRLLLLLFLFIYF